MKARSAVLLDALIARAEFSEDHLAQMLACAPGLVAEFAAGQAAMPLATQLLLADFVIAKVPTLARRGHSLKAQVAAATSFRDGDTRVHNEPPGRWSSRRKKS